MKVMYINEKAVQFIDIEDILETYYEMIDCDFIDITMRKIGGRYFDVIVDDEGLLKGRMVQAYSADHEPMLAGSMIICHNDGEGGLVGITEEDEEILGEHITSGIDRNGNVVPCIVGMEY